jgi:hypothetical protein
VITGFAEGSGDGRVLILLNSSGSTITLTGQSGQAVGRILGTSTLLLGDGSALMFFYDAQTSAWVEIAR